MTQNTSGVAVLSPMVGTALSAKNLGAMLLLALMWGLSVPVTKIGLETIPPITLTALRFVVAVPLFLVLSVGRLRVPWRAVPGIVGLGVMGIAGGNVTQAFGVQGTSASAGTIISATIPIFVVVFAAIRLHQPVTGRQWIGLFAAFCGIALVAAGSGSDADDMTTTTLTGVAWMLVSAVIIAFYFIWSAELAEKYGALPVAAWNALAGLVAVLPLAGWEATHTPAQITAQAVWAIVYLASMVTVAGLFLWLYLLRVVPARVAASVQYLQPVFGIAAAALIFGDPLGMLFGAGVILILAGLALAAVNKRTGRLADTIKDSGQT